MSFGRMKRPINFSPTPLEPGRGMEPKGYWRGRSDATAAGTNTKQKERHMGNFFGLSRAFFDLFMLHAAMPSEPLVNIPKDARKGKLPCGECHLQPGETCDVCAAPSGSQAGDGTRNRSE